MPSATHASARVSALGATALGLLRAWAALHHVFVRTLAGALRGQRPPGEVLAQMYQVGNRSLLFLAVTMGFLGMVMVFQTCLQLSNVTGDLSLVGGQFLKYLVQEFGPSIGATLLATRIGAGIAAEVGSMVVTEQVDALRMCGVDPVEYLIVPRFLASLVMTAVLCTFAVAVAFTTGGLTAYYSFHVNPNVYLDFSQVRAADLGTGLVKCLVYGAAIPTVSGYCGLTATRGSEGVGMATTRAVIYSSLAVIVLDLLVSGIAFVTVLGEGVG